MTRTIIITILALSVFACKEEATTVPTSNNTEELKVDERYRPLIHHFSSTGCGPCGRFGIPVLSQVAQEMGDTVLPLITHFKYNDPFITSSSEAIEQAVLVQWYSPQIWVNSNNITFSILNDNIPTAVEKTKSLLRAQLSNEAEAYVGLKSSYNANERYDVDWLIKNNTTDSATFHVEVYAMEDGIVASQAGADPFVSTHFRVNRGGHYGNMGKKVALGGDETMSFDFEFIPCWVCEVDKQYFNIIVWKETSPGRFSYVNGLEVK
ncbi:MAG: hypothetical protein JXR19_09660 [Bacteroidia bacterium]